MMSKVNDRRKSELINFIDIPEDLLGEIPSAKEQTQWPDLGDFSKVPASKESYGKAEAANFGQAVKDAEVVKKMEDAKDKSNKPHSNNEGGSREWLKSVDPQDKVPPLTSEAVDPSKNTGFLPEIGKRTAVAHDLMKTQDLDILMESPLPNKKGKSSSTASVRKSKKS
mmetsp:Transcript_14068/g.21933  ORF Transcript_14068/g.21933 Transcript_14068/m.21933 type:complete len:168 (+) Transcript_14068:3953-4456(+)